MDFSRLNTGRVIVGAIASILLIISTLFLPWYAYDLSGVQKAAEPDEWICGVGDTSCTGFDTFPILRWLLLLAALAPLILGWILVRGHKLSWAPGEMTMIAGFAATILIVYNGIIDKPGSGIAEVGLGLDYGYWIALVGAITIAAVGFTRSLESGPRRTRKAPGTV
ncbi:MAG TPA: hypothetical protein VK326_04745 [Solirubrobacterales bacterium]|nr:hypothetical protein [Solirubrobacterales bacterium]